MQAELGRLAMEKTRFDVAFEPADAEAATADASLWTERASGRPSSALAPAETCGRSRGSPPAEELSRLMLAIKSVIGRDAPGLTLVFDEVDSGIGGRVAEVVGRKLKAVSARCRILCVTRLPQIAALAASTSRSGSRWRRAGR
ncbi:MAG: hypothetical protein U0599_03905 [Vicinamibacteria bacterium]